MHAYLVSLSAREKLRIECRFDTRSRLLLVLFSPLPSVSTVFANRGSERKEIAHHAKVAARPAVNCLIFSGSRSADQSRKRLARRNTIGAAEMLSRPCSKRIIREKFAPPARALIHFRLHRGKKEELGVSYLSRVTYFCSRYERGIVCVRIRVSPTEWCRCIVTDALCSS